MLLTTFPLLGQRITISGFVRDVSSGEALMGAAIYVPSLETGTITNAYGFYSLSLPAADSINVVYSYMGYRSEERILRSQSSLKLDVVLEATVIELEEVVASGQRLDENVEKNQISVINVPLGAIRKLPTVLGEVDVLKVVQFLPGVQSSLEGTSGFYVRGGNADQNLIQLDEAVIYNPTHLFGLVSTFNSRAINTMTLIKGGFPAQYGGRLSSTMNITMKEGNDKEYHLDGGIGFITSKLTIEGPIIKNRASFIVSARSTNVGTNSKYMNLFLKPFPAFSNTNYHFYDMNAKINFKISEKDRVYLSYFNGLDSAAYVDPNSLNYKLEFGNTTKTVRWNHLFGKKLFANTSLIFTDYLMSLRTLQGNFFAEFYSAIKDANAKIDLDYFISPKHTVKFGINYKDHVFTPTGTSGKVPKDSTIITIQPKVIQEKTASEVALYVNDEYRVTDRLGLNIGLRAPLFWATSKSYYKLEPRTNLKYTLTPHSSLKMAYTIMNQFVHLVPSATASIPTDIWLLTSDIVKPQHSQQVALGYFRNFRNNTLETSLETYYKTMDNQVAFKEGTRLIEQTNIDSQLVFGKGWSYGVEFFLNKRSGSIRGWLSYTLSWTDQQFNELNFGRTFPFKYDRRHNLSVVATYDLSEKLTLAADFVFTTGNVVTLPAGRVLVHEGGGLHNGIYDVYTGRNNQRLNPYHRLDVSVTYKHQGSVLKKKFNGELVFSVYNLYDRRNPYFVYVDVDAVTRKPFAKQVSLLPIIPSINYNVNF
ncbi:carboxypeptidase-like regulatory domain-containing protein [Candidatus Neomarinimicrobiota bacterium]